MALVHLHALARRYPNLSAVVAELANLGAILTLPKPTVHIVSDVHGEFAKLRQVVNNASGSLRPLVERVVGAADAEPLLALIYYPYETWQAVPAADRPARLRWFVAQIAPVVRELARPYTQKHLDRVIPDPFDAVVRELLFERELARPPAFVDELLAPFLRHGRDRDLVRSLAHVVRNLAVGELVVAGDLGDRGPRLDKVLDVLMAQPNVSFTWGNHDANWMAACLGHPAAIATVVRLSLRYQRLAQLEEGFGISLAPLAQLARDVYGDDPAERFRVKGEPAPDPLLLARMHKAIAIVQFKLEGQLFRRRTDWGLAERALLHRIDGLHGTIELDGRVHALLDTRLPTLDAADPYALSAGEAACLDALTRAFTESATLWRQLRFVASHGAMSLRRDRCAIFHGCVPVDEAGAPLPFVVDGEARRGKALFDAIEVVVQRAFRSHAIEDADLLFYLWTGPASPCFGKDRMATFETYFLADPATHEERKNPYFALLDDADFCARVLRDFGVDERGFIVNGHVPVRLEQGEQPIKRSGRAITIDGAFAAAYGDKGFSLVLDARRIYLAQHHHFEQGTDIVPTVAEVEAHDPVRTVGDTETGEELRAEMAVLEELVRAYQVNLIREQS